MRNQSNQKYRRPLDWNTKNTIGVKRIRSEASTLNRRKGQGKTTADEANAIVQQQASKAEVLR